MTKLILGAFSDRDQADETIKELEVVGIPAEDFSLITNSTEAEASMPVRSAETTAAAGSAVGGLAGLTLGAITTAGMLVAGPVALLAGLGWIALTTAAGGVVGAAAGGIVGALMGLGIPETTARHQESILRKGGVLLGVEDNEVDENIIRDSFADHDADEIVVVEHDKLNAKLAALTA